jgi:preprotein translocase subunit SecG
MMGLVIMIHVLACVILITIILIQRGRGGGFIESFAGLESMFGTKTSAFLSRMTSIMAVVFFFTCLGLAFLSLKESKSLMLGVKPKAIPVAPANATAASEQNKPVEAQQPASPAAAAPAAVPMNQTAK